VSEFQLVPPGMCPTCRQPMPKKGRRVCGTCLKPIRRGHRYRFTADGVVRHWNCEQPTAEPPAGEGR